MSCVCALHLQIIFIALTLLLLLRCVVVVVVQQHEDHSRVSGAFVLEPASNPPQSSVPVPFWIPPTPASRCVLYRTECITVYLRLLIISFLLAHNLARTWTSKVASYSPLWFCISFREFALIGDIIHGQSGSHSVTAAVPGCGDKWETCL